MIFDLLFPLGIYAQSISESLGKKAVFLEIGGNGFGISANYEHLWKERYAARIGLGYFPIPESSFILSPLMVSRIYKQRNHYWEAGLGVVFFKHSQVPIGYDLTASIGYKKMFCEHYFFKTMFTPFVTITDRKYQLLPYIGFAVGVRF